jgi:quercetin dioxygenase-like cupin family protein
MAAHPSTFDDFQQQALDNGFDEALVREWAPNFSNEVHSHPFDTHALVVQGECWLSVDGQVQHLIAGDTFDLGRDVPHAERYGPEGATFWAARRNQPLKPL